MLDQNIFHAFSRLHCQFYALFIQRHIGASLQSVTALGSSYNTYLSTTTPVHVTGSSESIYLYAQQNSGSALNTTYYWRIIRIA